MRVRLSKAKPLIETVRVPRGEQTYLQSAYDGMLHGCPHHELTEPKTSVSVSDKDIAQPGEGCFIGYPSREPHLLSVGAVAPDDERASHRTLYLIKTSP